MKKLVAPLAAAIMLFTASPSALAYSVKPGDTLSQIAKDKNVSLYDLIKLNPRVEDPNLIYPGDVIKTTSDIANPPEVSRPTYDANDLDVLSRIIEAEAGGEPYQGKIAVGQVILNRVVSTEFPNSIKSVVYQSGQFSPVMNGSINNKASDDSIRAAKEVLSAYVPDPKGILYFYDPKYTSDSWIRTRDVVEVIGNQIFSK